MKLQGGETLWSSSTSEFVLRQHTKVCNNRTRISSDGECAVYTALHALTVQSSQFSHHSHSFRFPAEVQIGALQISITREWLVRFEYCLQIADVLCLGESNENNENRMRTKSKRSGQVLEIGCSHEIHPHDPHHTRHTPHTPHTPGAYTGHLQKWFPCQLINQHSTQLQVLVYVSDGVSA